MHINTKVVFEWDPNVEEYIEVYSEGFEHGGDVAQLQFDIGQYQGQFDPYQNQGQPSGGGVTASYSPYTVGQGDPMQVLMNALQQAGIDPSQMLPGFGTTGGELYGAGTEDIMSLLNLPSEALQSISAYGPFNLDRFTSAIGGLQRQRGEDIGLGTRGIRTGLLPGAQKAREVTGGFAGGGAQESLLSNVLGTAAEKLTGLTRQAGRTFQTGLGTAFGGAADWLQELLGIAGGYEPELGGGETPLEGWSSYTTPPPGVEMPIVSGQVGGGLSPGGAVPGVSGNIQPPDNPYHGQVWGVPGTGQTLYWNATTGQWQQEQP